MLAFEGRQGDAWLRLQETDPDPEFGDPFDASQTDVDWSSSVNYQQRLVGSVTFTPRVSFAGQYRRIDTLAVAQNFVAGPVRTAFGATLRGDIYGFFPGFAGFSRIRHKVSPSFTYDWAPEVTTSELQSEVFGARTSRPRNVVSVTLNQTFEAKRESDQDSVAPPPTAGGAPGEPTRLPQAQIVNLLSLRTSAIQYDFVEADDLGFLQGFQTTRLTNQISSDFLRGLSLSTIHDLFRDEPVLDAGGSPTGAVDRTFDPQLVQMNLGFSLNGRSSIFRWLGFGGGDDDEEEPAGEEGEDRLEEDDIFADDADPLSYRDLDEASIVPGARQSTAPRRGGGAGSWSANFSYSLARPRAENAVRSQMLQGTLRFKPTDMWEMSWRTSYDIEAQTFNDHSIRLSRDLHRWRANFDFRQTATGNWSFRFEISLIDNSDLKFDYQQRSLDRLSGG